MIIALYEPVTWAYASGSVVDVLASVAGAGLGLWVGTRARRGIDTISKNPREID